MAASETFTRPSVLNINRRLLERKAKEHIEESDGSPEEKLIAYETFMENIDKYLDMDAEQRKVA